MFVPYTRGSELAKELRETEYQMGDMTGSRLKVVERAGVKLMDMLTRANPWKGQDCGRQKCLLCETKKYTGKHLGQECTRRNLVYETRCITCEERENKKIEEETAGDDKKGNERKQKMKLYKYVGETARSVY